ncbi:MAG: GAF domain-containing protein [Gemmatimonadota bacterium]
MVHGRSAPVPADVLHQTLKRLSGKGGRDWPGPAEALRRITEAAADALDVDRVSVWLFNPEGNAITCRELFLRKEGRHTDGLVLKAHDFPAYFEALRSEEVIDAADAASDPRTREFADAYLPDHGITSMLDAPIWTGGSVSGVVCHEHVGPPRVWSGEEQEFAVSLGELCSLVLETARREDAQARVRAMQMRHRRFFDGTRVALIEADLSAVLTEVGKARQSFSSPEEALDRDRQILSRLVSTIRLRGANRAAVETFAATSEEELLDHSSRVMDTPGGWALVAHLFRSLWEGKDSADEVTPLRTLQGQTRELLISVRLPYTLEEAAHSIVNVVDVTRRRGMERVLEELAIGTSGASGQGYFRAMVEHIGSLLGAHLAFVARVVPGTGRLRTLAVWEGGEPRPNFDFEIAGSPCEPVLSEGPLVVGDGIRKRFPGDNRLRHTGGRGFVGIPLLVSQGKALGVVVGLFNEPLPDSARSLQNLIQILAMRAGAELRRDLADQDRIALQEQLIQAQRLESVGRLAGGIAHDFNNLLAPIVAYSEIALQDMGADDEFREEMRVIHDAAARASKLTRQLLAFSRRQVLETAPVDLTEVVRGFESMVRTVVREDIDLQLVLEQGLPMVRGDRGQLEQALMNLVVNAEDALPEGGTLCISTALVELPSHGTPYPDIPPGRYVALRVRDTGVGMDATTLERAFEPFFSTKGSKDGTGLGLASVYGIVQQHGGTIRATSTLGEGSTFEILLPIIEGQKDEAASASVRSQPANPAGTETILVVEDEPAVRTLVVAILERLGYEVLEADDPMAALDIVRKHDLPIHLLLSDVVMPRIDGVQLYREVSAINPDIRMLYMSGYAHPVLESRGVGGAVNLLNKPFTVSELARKVRETLDA